MGEAAYIACTPVPMEGKKQRSSNDFCINQLPHNKKMKWHVITTIPEDTDVTFNIMEHYDYKEDEVRYVEINNGRITDYNPYRNLYVCDVKNATGHFIVKVEILELEEI